MEHIQILGIRVTSATMKEIHHEISRIIKNGGPGFILSANIHGLNLADRFRWLADFYNRADLVEVDGAGVVLGARILGYKIHKRMTWADWGWHMADYFAEKGHSVFLVGGAEGVAEEAAKNLTAHAPELKICGTHHGFFMKNGIENENAIKLINSKAPDILWVGMGMPMQEKWILENHKKINAKVFMPCGAAFSYFSGQTSRCPKWLGDIGMEWLYRLAQEPRRMASRYLIGNFLFISKILLNRMKIHV